MRTITAIFGAAALAVAAIKIPHADLIPRSSCGIANVSFLAITAYSATAVAAAHCCYAIRIDAIFRLAALNLRGIHFPKILSDAHPSIQWRPSGAIAASLATAVIAAFIGRLIGKFAARRAAFFPVVGTDLSGGATAATAAAAVGIIADFLAATRLAGISGYALH